MKKERRIPKRGEVWYYHPGRTIGSELAKPRRAIVVSSDRMGILPVKLIVPLTTWDERYTETHWHVRIEPDPNNGITKVVAADVLLMRSISHERFGVYVGHVSATVIEEIAAAIAAVVEYG
jgi:mRNA interferase MazF